jgi:DNA modification methylase
MEWDAYYTWCKEWLSEIYRVLKPDGRFCLNHYLSLGQSDNRHAPLMDLNYICTREIGFKHHGLACWDDITLTKRTAWGSWISASAPYINCLCPSTLVFTDNGIKEIQNIFAGDNVINADGERDTVLQSQCKLHNGDIIKITTQSNLVDPIYCTKEHNFLLMVRTTTFKNKRSYREYLWSDPQWIQAEEIIPISTYGRVTEKQYFIAYPIDKHSVLPEIPINSKLLLHNPDFYWFVGFYLAEGSVRKNIHDHGYDVYLTTHISELNDVSNLLTRINIKFGVRKWLHHCRFEISNKELYSFVHQFYDEGAKDIKGTKAHRKIIPEWIVNLPKEHLNRLLDGYYSGDGCLFKKRKIYGKMIVSTSKRMLIQMQRIMFKLGLYGKITLSTKAKTITKFNGIDKIVHIKERYNLIWYDHITKYTPAIFKEDKVWIKIKRVVSEHYNGLVYDLSISENPSYLLPQGVTHNSPYEGILILYKDHWHKDNKGVSDIGGKEFMQSCSGVWKLQPEMKGLTKANFPVSLPMRCIKLLSYKGDIVLDPFSGSATTAYAAKVTGRQYIGFELSENYWKIGNRRLEQNGLDSWMEPEPEGTLEEFV